jgi:hypothetical protein
MKMSTSDTSAKVSAATWAASLSAIVLYFVKLRVIGTTMLPPEIELALGAVITGAITGGVTWIVGYMRRPAPQDVAVPDPPKVPPAGIP